MVTTNLLPSYQRFVNGVPVPLFSRRSFRPREKYLILLVFLTFGVVCFGAFFFLPDFRSNSGGAAYNSVYRVYQKIQRVGPELLIPAPPHGMSGSNNPHGPGGNPNVIHVGLERPGDARDMDIHLIEDKQKLQAKIDEEYQQQKTLEKPDVFVESRSRVSSSVSPWLVDHRHEEAILTVPPAPADVLPMVTGGEDKDPITRKRRDKVKELNSFKKDGYVGEAHNVTTEDGYILTVHRITGSDDSTPVLLMHGLLCNSASWLIQGQKRALAYVLAEHGYDVWLGNVRGNNYGSAHVNMTFDDTKFWDFTFHEMGMYDLPATMNYITNLRKKKIFYIGHSQGTEIAFIMASRRPEYAKNIRLMIALAPVSQFTRKLFNKFIYPTPTVRFLLRTFCTPFAIQSYLCQIIVFSIVGFDFEQFNSNYWEVIFQGAMAGTSYKTMIHQAQHFRVKRFGEYDYGEEENIRVYNQSTPPSYDLSRVNMPIIFFSSKADCLSAYVDALDLYKKLPQTKGLFTIDYDKFTHSDYLWAINGKELVYDHVINILNSHQDP